MLAYLTTEPEIDHEAYIDTTTGFHEQDALFEALEQRVIGQSSRRSVLTIPGDKTEEEVQPVYLVETREVGYAKFMVRQFKGDAPNQKQTLLRWQVISE